MYNERYSIMVSDDSVVIHGDISIREAFDLISYFDQQGFKSLGCGDENSTLCFSRTEIDEMKNEKIEKEKKETEIYFERMYDAEKDQVIILQERVKDLEGIIKNNSLGQSECILSLRNEIYDLKKEKTLRKLQADDDVKKLLDGFSYKSPIIPLGTQADLVLKEKEKDKFEKLVDNSLKQLDL